MATPQFSSVGVSIALVGFTLSGPPGARYRRHLFRLIIFISCSLEAFSGNPNFNVHVNMVVNGNVNV